MAIAVGQIRTDKTKNARTLWMDLFTSGMLNNAHVMLF